MKCNTFHEQRSAMMLQTYPWKWIKIVIAISITLVFLHLYHHEGFFDSSMGTSKTSSSTGARIHDDICRTQKWQRFIPRSPEEPRKVYDLFMVNTELDWLEIRLNNSYSYVDYFVLVESNKTFTNLDKPLIYKDNAAKFAAYHDKIIYHEIEYPEDFEPHTTWDIEDFQRNAMLTQVFPKLRGARRPRDGDVIIVSDVDEISRPETLQLLRECQFPRRLTINSRFYYYSFQYLHRGPEWPHPQATYYQGDWLTIRPNDLRMGLGVWQISRFWPFSLMNWFDEGEMHNAGWHCSSCFATIEEFLTKMKSFSHIYMNKEEFRNKDRIADAVRKGKDLWDREGQEFDRIENNTDVPKFLLQNRERFRYMLNRDGASAGFADYTPWKGM
ncbi:glycosyltransferase [Diplogelasinospora grovesii]|uniref:Glycosyltransferase n=1 Tax=Diplogelasinospora grovesii TaxID=303347 RepID=A0AAN6NB32_9PEZI|nr:glycosyltransferase [Diplogelasinospora grovesii]